MGVTTSAYQIFICGFSGSGEPPKSQKATPPPAGFEKGHCSGGGLEKWAFGQLIVVVGDQRARDIWSVTEVVTVPSSAGGSCKFLDTDKS